MTTATARRGAAPRPALHVPAELARHLLDPDGPGWHAEASCAETDPDAFFPEKGGSTAEAKEVCRRCPVQAECLADALGNDQRFGVWGGYSERERRQLVKDHPADVVALLVPAPAAAPAPAPEVPAARPRRESVPAAEPSRNHGGGRPGATLPTGPRPHRVLRTGPRSTFPERARTTSRPVTASPAAAVSPTGATTPARRPRRAETAPSTRPGAQPAVWRDTHQPDAAQTTVTQLPGTGTGTGTGTVAAASAGEQETADDVAAPAAPTSTKPPDPTGSLADTVAQILTEQARHPEARHSEASGVDADRVVALAAGDGEPDSAGGWELRVAAVAAVLSGSRTRGQTARMLGQRSQDVAHWVRRWLEAMPLLDDPDSTVGADSTAGGARGRWAR